MAVRITNGMMSRNYLYNLNSIGNRLNKLNKDITTTVRIHKPSDDPVGTAKTMKLSTSLERNSQYNENVGYAVSWADATETAFNSLDSVMQRARELAVRGSTETMSEEDKKAIADEIDQLRLQVIDLGNANLDDRYIFAGTATEKAPFSDAGNGKYKYTGNTQQIMIEVSLGVNMPANIYGEQPFGECIDALHEFSETLISGTDNADFQTCLDKINKALNNVVTARSENGALTNRYEMVEDRLDDLELNYTSILSDTYDTDMSKAIMEMVNAESIQRAALSVGAKILQPSLVQFLS